MKILTMCQGGNCRSVSLAMILKYNYNYDVIACGWEKNSAATRNMLFTWADRIIVMQEEFRSYVPMEYIDKLSVFDVGPDRWFNPFHPELIDMLHELIRGDRDGQRI